MRCKLRKTDAYEVNIAMDQFWSECRRRRGLPVTGPLLQLQARRYAERLHITDLKASDGWLNRFKERHNISLRSIQSESNDVDPKTVKDWKAKLSVICQGYELEDIFNADETGLYFRFNKNL